MSGSQATLAEQINAALPQTQCKRCGYDDCAAYAQAIAQGQADINQCPPGGAEGVARLAAITGKPAKPLNPIHGEAGPRTVAVIDEAWCIGCTQCLPVCPTDAIVGANKVMHVVMQEHCTGCALCLPTCPVDCIQMVSVSGTATGWAAWSAPRANAAKQRYEQHVLRQEKTKAQSPAHRRAGAAPAALSADKPSPEQARKAAIEAALERARQKHKSLP
jgi:electron transport complex protein RnfB